VAELEHEVKSVAVEPAPERQAASDGEATPEG
jgi:hypothetical protein